MNTTGYIAHQVSEADHTEERAGDGEALLQHQAAENRRQQNPRHRQRVRHRQDLLRHLEHKETRAIISAEAASCLVLGIHGGKGLSATMATTTMMTMKALSNFHANGYVYICSGHAYLHCLLFETQMQQQFLGYDVT